MDALHHINRLWTQTEYVYSALIWFCLGVLCLANVDRFWEAILANNHQCFWIEPFTIDVVHQFEEE